MVRNTKKSAKTICAVGMLTFFLTATIFFAFPAAVRSAGIVGRGILTIRITEAPIYEGYVVYSDAGVPENSSIWTWDGSRFGLPPGQFDGNYNDPTAPEGKTCFLTVCPPAQGNYAGWGVFLMKGTRGYPVDLSTYKALKFWIKVEGDNASVRVQIMDNTMIESAGVRVDFGPLGEWKEVTIDKSAFSAIGGGPINFKKIYCPFMITIINPGGRKDPTLYVDYVRWIQ